MKTSLEEKRKNRFLLLRELYEMTNGVAERHLIDIREVGRKLGMDANVALEAFEYLKGEGLTKWMALGGLGTITHWGIREVEDAKDHKPTAHFPSDIFILTNSPGATVVSGLGHQLSTVFDQRNQQVNYQYNAAGDINLGMVQNKSELIDQLDLIKHEISKALTGQVISELIESKAKTQILEAIEEAKKPEPDKKSLLAYLGQAKDHLKDITAIAGIVDAITEAYKWVENIL